MASITDVALDDPGPRNRYPWHDWLDGRTWALDPAADFPAVGVKHFRSMAAAAAARRGKRSITVLRPDGTLLLRAVIR